ncbi:MAG: PEP-CTERM sorting domain-containing protein [Deltaproteobacteria bacterium]|nr:PEP-CTERM sorting domain-containing protein [Deltaproteobacteria bacterium]MBW1718040.1 PEP-CTERM sorting domain-containing protein [Deltaproteobacteria bacterium]MBW1931775.1 PEP-CTERM sorting domain-containing protein [Deltaproteobacteria bacterium]MBW1937228.1 PEP-CTERM sorting domain-containing protein [Deltaproteobacteria bacterium]MBW1963843.1 PEP-CTERM sorting domain-containing protein [Deltaproteobacteria bacterium]
MNRKFLGVLTLLLFLMGIISTSGIESAYALPMSGADARIFSVKWDGVEVDWLNPLEFSFDSHATGSEASSGLSSNNFGVEAYASPDLITSNWAWASASAWQYGTFKADSNGTLEVSVEYYLHQNLTTDAGTAQASSEAWLWLASTGNTYSENLFAISNDITGDYSESGILTVSLPFKQGNTGELSVGVWNETTSASPVPEPATIILLGCGLMSMALLGKRRLAAHQDQSS